MVLLGDACVPTARRAGGKHKGYRTNGGPPNRPMPGRYAPREHVAGHVGVEVPVLPERRLLDTTELFAALPGDVLDALSGQARVRNLRRNELLFAQGDQSHELFVVLDGRIAIAT